jgi:hypothetical protein
MNPVDPLDTDSLDRAVDPVDPVDPVNPQCASALVDSLRAPLGFLRNP